MAESNTKLIIAEGSAAIAKIALTGRSQALRHLHRTHRIATDWIYELLKPNSIIVRHVHTKIQIADLFTKPIAKSDSKAKHLKRRSPNLKQHPLPTIIIGQLYLRLYLRAHLVC